MKVLHVRRRALTIAFALTLAVGLVAVTAASAQTAKPAKKKPPFRVLLIIPKSGPLGFVGLLEARGMAAAQQVINKQGGILGHKVLIDFIDGQGSGTVTVAAVQQAIASGKKYGLITCGSFGSDAVPCAPVIAHVNALQIPLAAETALNNPGAYPNVFITSGGFQPGANGVVAKMKSTGITKFAILSGDDTTGHNGATALQAAAKAYGLAVSATVFVPDAAADATPQLQQAEASNPQAFAMSGFTPAIPATIKARSKLGLTNVPLYGDWLVASFNFGSFSTVADRENVWFQQLPYFVTGTPQYKSKDFQAFMKQLYVYEPNPALLLDSPYVAWDALMLARGAAIKAKSVDGNKMAKALAKISKSSDVPGFFGSKLLYGGKSRFENWKPSDFIWVKAGVQVKGILVPDK